jgi:azurin
MKKGLLLFVMGMFFLASCGSDKPAQDAPQKAETKATTPEASENEVTLNLAGNDQMQYDKKELRVKAGQKVTLNFEHVGELALEVMGHNFVLLVPGTDIAAFATEAFNFKDNDYIPEGTDAVIVHTKMLGGGEKTSITFDAPEKGTYDFICSFPGHYGMMQGKFIVE